jgi:hypothetical protein
LDEYKQIIDFNEIFLRKYITKIFDLKWFKLIKTILDLTYNSTEKSLESRFIYLSDDFLENEIKNKSAELNTALVNKNHYHNEIHYKRNRNGAMQIIVDPPRYIDNRGKLKKNSNETTWSNITQPEEGSQSIKKEFIGNSSKVAIEKKRNALQRNILFLINESKNSTFLIHETTQILLYSKWRYIPRFVYYFNLILYLLFLIFYTIQALGYIDDYYGLEFGSTIICTILLSYFILLEFSHAFYLKYLFFLSFPRAIQLVDFI